MRMRQKEAQKLIKKRQEGKQQQLRLNNERRRRADVVKQTAERFCFIHTPYCLNDLLQVCVCPTAGVRVSSLTLCYVTAGYIPDHSQRGPN